MMLKKLSLRRQQRQKSLLSPLSPSSPAPQASRQHSRERSSAKRESSMSEDIAGPSMPRVVSPVPIESTSSSISSQRRPSSASNTHVDGLAESIPALRVDSKSDWCVPEDAEGAYIRQTYAYFDKEGVRGDGIVEGREWTRERSPKPAWVVASEEAEARKARAERRDSAHANVGIADKKSDASLSAATSIAKRNGHLSPPSVTPRHSLSNVTHQNNALDGFIPDTSSEVSGDAARPLSAAQSTNAMSASTSSVGSQGDFAATVDVNGKPLLASDSDANIEVERNHLLNKIDRYGFFPRPEEEGVRGRGAIVILSRDSLSQIPRRNLLGRRSARSSRGTIDESALRAFAKRRTSATIEDGTQSRTDLADGAMLQKALEQRKAKEIETREREALRVAKWDRMLEIGRDAEMGLPVYRLQEGLLRSGKLRRRVFKGVPDRWRAAVWFAMLMEQTRADGEHRLDKVFASLQEQPSSHDVQIDLDVPRTISGHILFHTRYGQGQRALFHVLHAFSLHCADCAYCQGMGPIAATLLVYFSIERAFGSMVAMHDHDVYGLHKTFSPGFPGLTENFYAQRKLCEHLCPDILASLDAKDIMASSYATKWYITIFTNVFPFSTQLRLWDAYIYLGRDVLVVAATSILWSTRAQLLSGSFEDCMNVLAREFVPEDDDVLLNWIFAVMERDDTRKCLAAARAEYAELAKQGKPPLV